MEIKKLRDFAKDRGIELAKPKEIVSEATRNIKNKYDYSPEEVKANFDRLLGDSEKEAYRLYLEYEKEYAGKVFGEFIDLLILQGEVQKLEDVGDALGANFTTLDKFFVSLSNGRKSRAGSAFESFHNDLFRQLGYPFSEQPVINGKPDFLLPSAGHYQENATDCILFTVKRTLRERWRQVTTEGTRGSTYFLATIDESKSQNELGEMLVNRVFLVCPHEIKQRNEKYRVAQNVLSFQDFFQDHLDPAMERWKRNGVI